MMNKRIIFCIIGSYILLIIENNRMKTGLNADNADIDVYKRMLDMIYKFIFEDLSCKSNI